MQERRFERLGSTQARTADVRLVADIERERARDAAISGGENAGEAREGPAAIA